MACTQEKPMRVQPYKKNYRQPRKSGSKRGSSLQGGAYQLVVHC